MAEFSFIQRRKRAMAGRYQLGIDAARYIPLYGSWLIEIALVLNWHKPTYREQWAEIFSDTAFCAMTTMLTREHVGLERDTDPPYLTSAYCRDILIKQLNKLNSRQLPKTLPLFRNLNLFTELLQLTEADQVILLFAAGLSIFPEFKDAITSHVTRISTPALCKLLARISGSKERDLNRSLKSESTLINTGLIKINPHVCDLEDKISLMQGIEDMLLSPHKSVKELIACFVKRAPEASLKQDNFPHLQRDWEVLSSYLGNTVGHTIIGINVLLHGKPGVGKNEFASALAQQLGIELYEVAYSDRNGDPIKGEDRLRAYTICQRILAGNSNAMILFDEIEDIFGSGSGLISMLFGDTDDTAVSGTPGKAWINRAMENNRVPAIWISNKIGQIDKAYLRRFDYSVAFPTPPKPVREFMANHHLACFNPPKGWIERLATNDDITPAQFERAAKVAKIGSPQNKAKARELVEQVLDRSINLLGQRRIPQRNAVHTGYSLEWLNTDQPVTRLMEAIKRRPCGTFCFYGAAGTGKSELARYMADQAGKPLIVKRASDILGMYVGQTEQNIATMFTEAREQDAVLVLDEADSFLADRRDAQRSWEVTQVNELLTQMEAFEGIFVCTTNLMSKLDQASLRRFAFKVRFDPLKPEQRVALFRQELVRLGGNGSDALAWEEQVWQLNQLTPGDFAVAARQFELWDEPGTAVKLYGILKKECEAKGASPRKIGFGV